MYTPLPTRRSQPCSAHRDRRLAAAVRVRAEGGLGVVQPDDVTGRPGQCRQLPTARGNTYWVAHKAPPSASCSRFLRMIAGRVWSTRLGVEDSEEREPVADGLALDCPGEPLRGIGRPGTVTTPGSSSLACATARMALVSMSPRFEEAGFASTQREPSGFGSGALRACGRRPSPCRCKGGPAGARTRRWRRRLRTPTGQGADLGAIDGAAPSTPQVLQVASREPAHRGEHGLLVEAFAPREAAQLLDQLGVRAAVRGADADVGSPDGTLAGGAVRPARAARGAHPPSAALRWDRVLLHELGG